MNLGDVRKRVLEQLDWQPTQSADFVALVDRLINRSYQTLCREAPYLFWEQKVRFATQADVSSVSGVTGDRLRVHASDQYVLERLESPTGGATWVFDGTWDGRHIEITDSDGQTHRRIIREIWNDGSDNRDRISLDHPWPNNTDATMTYRIFTDRYYLPNDTIELRSATLFTDTNYRLSVATQYDMERLQLQDFKGRFSARPEVLYRGEPFHLPAPTYTPETELLSSVSWAGPQPAGKFDYCYTYCWGRRDLDFDTPTGLKNPKWESPPSPISAAVETTYSGGAIQIVVPDIDHVLNFGDASSKRLNRSGYYIRVYARRYSRDGSPRVESPEVFFLLTEITASQQSYNHDGSVLMDYQTRLRDTHGYQSVKLYPMPDARYEVDIRTLARPKALVHDQDTPLIFEDGTEALILKTLQMLHRHNGSEQSAAISQEEYDRTLRNLTKRYGSIPYQHIRKRPARVVSRGSRNSRRAVVGSIKEL
jgi:hypothetical protein